MKKILMLIAGVMVFMMMPCGVQANCPVKKIKEADQSPYYRFNKKYGNQPYYFSDEARSRYSYYGWEKGHYIFGQTEKFNPREKDAVYKWYARYSK